MKIKKLLIAILSIVIVLGSLLCSGCEVFEDYYYWMEQRPSYARYKPEKLEKWDGNYIYHKNMRYKTTGEDGEVLFDTVSINGKSYPVEGAWDTEYVEDDIFYVVKIVCDKDKLYALTKYNIKNKTVKILYYSEKRPLKSVFKYRQNDIILALEKDEESTHLITIDYDGNIIEQDSNYYLDYTMEGDTFLVRKEEDGIYIRDWENAQEYNIGFNKKYRVYAVRLNGHVGVMLKRDKAVKELGEDVFVEEVYFYDWETGVTTKLMDFEENYTGFKGGCDLELYGNDNKNLENYCFKYNKMEGDYLKNCILYKAVREANGHVVLREVYNFDKFTKYPANFTDIDLVYKDKFYIRAKIQTSDRSYYGRRYRWFVLEIKNGEGTLKEIREAEYRASEYYSEENEIQRELEDVTSRRCGKYIYYLEIKYFASHIGSSSRVTIHQICRYDIETGEKVVMQIDDDYAEAEYERYIKDFTPIDWCVRDY